MKKIEYFGAKWCESCKTVLPIVEKLENVEVEIIDVEKETERAVSLSIRSIPVIMVLDEEGNQLGRLVGKITKQQIEELTL